MSRFYPWIFACFFLITSCSMQKEMGKKASTLIFSKPGFSNAYVGISIYEPASGKYWYRYHSNKYFVPASNTKIPTAYAAMKFLGDSLVTANLFEDDTAVYITPFGDPTLLHPDFHSSPLVDEIKKRNKPVYIYNGSWKTEALGSGWSWNDYNEYYMTERSAMPVHGNVITWIQEAEDSTKPFIFSEPDINWPVEFNENGAARFDVIRKQNENHYTLTAGKEKRAVIDVPYITDGVASTATLLEDITGVPVRQTLRKMNGKVIRSFPLDSVLIPMLHRSDNFFAEQLLLAVSYKMKGVFDESIAVDSLMRSSFSDLPQRPRWADGSGLSRYNLFSPDDFISILGKIRTEFGMDRVKKIFATGGEGTLGNYYKKDSGYIFAKTGTLSGVVALSGFLETKKGKQLVFSVLVNNHQSSATEIRRALEGFLSAIRNEE